MCACGAGLCHHGLFHASMMGQAPAGHIAADAMRRMSRFDVYGATKDHHGQWLCR
jgi:hypothetical protein